MKMRSMRTEIVYARGVARYSSFATRIARRSAARPKVDLSDVSEKYPVDAFVAGF
jgi:hypothetical protein